MRTLKILHITPHLGGGVGSVIMGWMDKVKKGHTILCLDQINPHQHLRMLETKIPFTSGLNVWPSLIHEGIKQSDIVIVHYWDHPMLAELFSRPIPDCRLVFWCHKNIRYNQKKLDYPDAWIDTSPIQKHGKYIWSTGDISRFLEIKPRKHKGFNIGTVISKKMNVSYVMELSRKIKKAIPDSYFTWLGDFCAIGDSFDNDNFPGKVNDIAPYLAKIDVFCYPLRPDHYGTCEQALGEAMAAGVVPVVMDNPAEGKIISHFYDGFQASTETGYRIDIEWLYNHPETRNWMANNARESAKKLYSIDTMISQWNNVFEKMMEQSKRERRIL